MRDVQALQSLLIESVSCKALVAKREIEASASWSPIITAHLPMTFLLRTSTRGCRDIAFWVPVSLSHLMMHRTKGKMLVEVTCPVHTFKLDRKCSLVSE